MIKLILAEDKKYLRILYREIIEARILGLAIKTVVNGEEAIKAIEKEEFNIFLIDYEMPKADGFVVFRKARELGLGKRVALMSGHSLYEIKKAYKRRYGAEEIDLNYFLGKPFSGDDLAEMIIEIIKASR